MRACNFDDVQEHRDWYPLILKVNGDSNERLMIWWCPRVSGKAQGPVVALESTQVSFTSEKYKTYRPTCSIFAIRCRTCLKTCFTSHETVLGEGMWYPGRPVFIRDWNPRSFTILNGRLLSETQWTISALHCEQRIVTIIHIKGYQWYIPRLGCCMLSVPVAYRISIVIKRCLAFTSSARWIQINRFGWHCNSGKSEIFLMVLLLPIALPVLIIVYQ